MDELLMLLQAKLDEAKSKGNINSDIKKVQNQIDKLKVQAEIDPKALSNLVKQVESAINQKINISNINIDTSAAQKAGQKAGQAVVNATQKEIDKLNQKFNKIELSTDLTKLTTDYQKFGVVSQQVENNLKELKTAHESVINAKGTDRLATEIEKYDTALAKAKSSMKELTTTQVSMNQRTSQMTAMQEWMRKNKAATELCGDQVKQLIAECNTCDKVRFDGIKNEFKQLQVQAGQAGKLGNSFLGSLVDQAKKFSQWISVSTLILGVGHSIKNATSFAKELNSALTNINYTMDVTKSQLTDIGYSAIQMAKDLKTSASNVLGAVTLYANAKETADSILKKSEAAIMLSNVTGMTGEQSAKALQSVMNQFELTQDDLMYISDTIQKVSQNMAYDFSSGIEEIVGGIERSGSVAKAAGLDLSEYASMLGLVIEKTGLSGETIGTAYRTILTRITKASKIEGTSDEDISKAETALKAVGVQVRSTAGEFRDMTDIMSDLGKVWNNLNDVQQANISFEIAGTRQTNIVKTLLGYWTDYEDLATKAGDAAGTTLENQGKYEETLEAKTQKLTTTMQSFWHNLIGAEEANGALEVFQSIATALDTISSKLGSLGSIGLGAGLFAGIKNVGKRNYISKLQNYYCF